MTRKTTIPIDAEGIDTLKCRIYTVLVGLNGLQHRMASELEVIKECWRVMNDAYETLDRLGPPKNNKAE